MAFAAAKAIPPGGTIKCGCSSSGRAPPCQGGGSEFEPRQPLQKTKHRLSVDAFCFIRRIFLPRASIFSSIRQHRFAISPVPASLMQKARICPIESVFWPPSAARGVGAHRQGQKGTGHHMVSCPPFVPAGEHRQSPRRWAPTSPPPDGGSPYGVISPVGKYFAC